MPNVTHCWLLIAALFAALLTAGCQSTGSDSRPTPQLGFHQASPTGFASGVWVQDQAKNARPWVILLPGASGLKIFDDDGHYFRAAQHLSEQGMTVLVIDYKRSYKQSPVRPNVPTGQKISWVIEQAITWAREQGIAQPNQPGAIVAWSLGAEGLWPIFAQPVKAGTLGITAAAAYYPSNEEEKSIKPPIRFLVLTGEKDDVTKAPAIRKALSPADPSLLELHVYPGANHGFDVHSIQPPRKLSLIPLIGPSATFGFDPAAAKDAQERLDQFLKLHLHPR